VPLVYESFDWAHGVYLGATMGSETTAAASGTVGVVRRDPMAMLPFCGYNMGDYFNHWLMIRRKLQRAPRIFMVNWFRKDRDGSFLWPGFGENLRVLKWIVDRVRGRVDARETPIGLLPKVGDLDLNGLDIPNDQLTEALAVKPREWVTELGLQEKFFASIGETLPPELEAQLEAVRTGIEAGRQFGDDLWNLASRTA
jgi:phosphoenolpyruvate carboxykinase (GTP)